MNDYECVLDFSMDDVTDEDRANMIRAIRERKKIKTTISYEGDGDYNNFNIGENWFPFIVFNTNTCVGLGTDMGMTVNYGEYSKEDLEELEKDLKENGPDDGYNDYLKSSKDDFLE